jgi:hypothetical protein
MNILRRGVPAAKEATKKSAADATVGRRIEVTVERETVTMLVRNLSKAGSEERASGNSRPESEPRLLLSPAPALSKPCETCPTCGSRSMVLLAEALPGRDLTLPPQDIDGSCVHLHRSPSGEWWVCKQSLHGR